MSKSASYTLSSKWLAVCLFYVQEVLTELNYLFSTLRGDHIKKATMS